MGKYYSKTFRLFARPSFVTGMARIFDFAGVLNRYNVSKTPQQADFRAIRSDWEMAGQDLNSAIGQYEQSRK